MTRFITNVRLAKYAFTVALALLLGATLCLALFRIATIYLYFSLPIEMTYGESIMVRIARGYREGMPIYGDWHNPPYLFAAYGPLAYALPSWVSSFAAGDEVGLLLAGRAVSLIGSVTTLLLIALILHRKAVAWPIILLADLCFLSAEITWPVQMTFRPDAMEVCWILAGLAAASVFQWRALALIPFLVACLFKQSAIIAPVTLGLYVLASDGLVLRSSSPS